MAANAGTNPGSTPDGVAVGVGVGDSVAEAVGDADMSEVGEPLGVEVGEGLAAAAAQPPRTTPIIMTPRLRAITRDSIAIPTPIGRAQCRLACTVQAWQNVLPYA